MKIHGKIHGALLAGVMAASFAAPALADPPMPQPQQAGDITYISGGIGADELAALREEAKGYNLKIISSNKQGEFTADANFEIANKNGREMINVAATGPLLYVKLPPGEYTVRAKNGDQFETRDVKVKANTPTDIHMVWQQS